MRLRARAQRDKMRACMSRFRSLVVIFVLSVVCAVVPRAAHAQWYFVGYLGANATEKASVAIELPAANASVVFRDVEFAAEPFESPQYYGWRLGRLLGSSRRFGVEVEFIHLKVIGLTGRAYALTGTPGSLPVVSGQPMSAIVQRYSMTHGLNFLVVNAVLRHELAERRAAFVARAGAGPTVPHTETTVLGGAVDKYEFGGLGVHAAAGIDVTLAGRLSFTAEYKLTAARPEISIAGGTGRTTAVTHHVAAGLAFGFAR